MTAAIQTLQQHRQTPGKGLAFKAIRKNGIWVVTALVCGEVEHFDGRTLGQALRKLVAEPSRTVHTQVVA